MPDAPAPPKPPARFDLHAIYETLRSAKATEPWLSDWISLSYEAPEPFREALYNYAQTRRRGMKSRLGKGYEIYHDCVVAHVGAGKTALVVSEGGALEEISYDTLNDRATSLSAAWAKAGVEPGASACVVLPPGVDYVVALLAALRMGLAVSTLHPHGPAYVKPRLEALACDFVVTNERLRNALALPEGNVLPVASTLRAGAPGVHAYAAKDVAVRLLSPFVVPDPQTVDELDIADPIETSASALHAAIVRDGMLVLGLDPSDVVSMPGFDPAQFQPAMLLAVLAAGAAWAEIPVKDLERDPKLLERAKVSVLGIGRALREQILARGIDPLKASVRVWFRSLTEVLEPDRWEALGRLFAGTKLVGFNLVANAATGGAELWGPRTAATQFTGALTFRVWPVPARTWQIAEVAASGMPALNEVGVYAVLEGTDPAPGLPRMILSRQRDGFFFAGAIDAGQNAQAYPRVEVAAAAAGIPVVRHAVVVVAAGRWMNDARTILLVFVDDARGPDGRIVLPVTVPEIQARVAGEVGAAFAPERVEIYPLRPRFNEEGRIDHAWCRSQYLTGALSQKARSESFILLSRLGYILAGGPQPG